MSGVLFLALSSWAWGQQAEELSPWQQQPALQLPASAPERPVQRSVEVPERNGPVAQLYRALRSTSIDPSRVFHVREAVMDRGELHLYFTDGTIGFTEDVAGHVTGAFFEGEGEVLMRPPDLTEHASLGLFSGLGVLNEHFSEAYLSFNGDVMAELKPFLRESEDQEQFLKSHGEMARDLAGMDALRLLESFTEDAEMLKNDHFLHARLGTKFGSLDVYEDSLAEEEFKVARLSQSGAASYFDVWMAFAGKDQREHRREDGTSSGGAVPVESFHIEASLTPPETMEATAELELRVARRGRKLLSFELSRWLQVSKVEVDGAEVEFLQNEALSGSKLARMGDDLVTVVMPEPVKVGEHHRLRFHYAGAVMQQAAPGLLYVGARGTWYPNRGEQMSLFDLKFRWPKGWTLVATGNRISLRNDGEMQSGEWNSEVRIPVAGFNLGRFTRAATTVGGVEVESYSTGTVEASLAKVSGAVAQESEATNEAIARRSAEAIEKYSEWFGAYPYKSLAITQLPGPISQGWPTLVYLTSLAYLTDKERDELHLSRFDLLLYRGFMEDHETAHQWWGDRVGWSSYRDQWLMEALANLSALMILEKKSPADARELMESYRSQLLATNANGKSYADAGPVTLGYRLSSSVFPNAYIPVTYGRGLWLLTMLRDYFEDSEKLSGGESKDKGRFEAALREFGRRYERRMALTDDFRRVLEEFLPEGARYEGQRSLKWFFDEWVRGNAVPRIELRKVVIRRKGEAMIAGFDLSQEECPESLVTSVPIFAEMAGGKRVLVKRVFADGRESHFEFEVPTGTRRLLADPEKKLLRLY
jgi:hypothetical protein